MRARAPASAANLGPGFDALAVALSCYVEVRVEPAREFSLKTSGEGANLPGDRDHLAARVAIAAAGHDRLSIEVDSDIPVARGLGSSAAVAVAAAAAAGSEDPFIVGVQVDGHPENAAASAFGGLAVATTVKGIAVHRQLPLDPELRFVLLIPDRELPTHQARAALPQHVPHVEAAYNLGRLGLLIAGLADHTQLLPEASDDWLHQDARSVLFPEAPEILHGLRQAGALTSSWSGAGPSLLAVCTEATSGPISSAAENLMSAHGVAGEVRVLEADRGGVTVFGAPGK